VGTTDALTPETTVGMFFCDWEGSSDEEAVLRLVDWVTILLVARRAFKHNIRNMFQFKITVPCAISEVTYREVEAMLQSFLIFDTRH
jgi:hypothetical protein